MSRPAFVLVLFLPAILLLSSSGDGAMDPEPSPDLTPEEVIRLQVEALQANDEPEPDAGIALAFRFASPGNRAATGPLERFIAMVKGPTYRDMLGFESATYGAIRVQGDEAAQRVVLVQSDGRRVSYVFGLSRQIGGEYDGCWMTDAVIREADPPSSGLTRI
ncbi:MAG: DUF4864 domain-containing protein [Bacteroidota bacterium]